MNNTLHVGYYVREVYIGSQSAILCFFFFLRMYGYEGLNLMTA